MPRGQVQKEMMKVRVEDHGCIFLASLRLIKRGETREDEIVWEGDPGLIC